MKNSLYLVIYLLCCACWVVAQPGEPEIQETPVGKPEGCPKVPQTTLFAWVAIIFLATACLICLVPFLVLACSSVDEIADGYPTISSFSSDPHANPTASRFILIMTCIIGGSLTSLLIEEYNSRCDHDLRFFVEVSACAFLPAVGIFYTAGNRDSNFYNRYYTSIRCGKLTRKACKIRIAASDFLHSAAALYFMVGNAALNMTYAINLYENDDKKNRPHSKPTNIAMILSGLTLIILGAFISTMALLTFIPKRVNDNPRKYRTCRCDCTGQDCKRFCRCFGGIFVGLFQLIIGIFRTLNRGISSCYNDCCPPFHCAEENEYQVCKNCYGDSPLKYICPDCGHINNVEERMPRARTSRRILSVFAFFLEFAALLLVVATTAFCSIKRNNAVPWWK